MARCPDCGESLPTEPIDEFDAVEGLRLPAIWVNYSSGASPSGTIAYTCPHCDVVLGISDKDTSH